MKPHVNVLPLIAYKSINNINALQVLRAVAAIMVVLRHSSLSIKNTAHNYWDLGGKPADSLVFLSPLNHLDFGVDIFFCISGFIVFMLIEKCTPNIESSIKFLLNRAIRILPPYWFFTTLVVVVYVASSGHFNVGHLTGNLSTDSFRFFYSLLMLPQQESPILGVGWTLVHESLFYLLCTLVITTQLNQKLHYVLAILSIIAVILAFFKITILYGYAFSTFNIEFFLGALAYKLSNRENKYPLITIFTGIFFFLLASYLLDSAILPNIAFLIRSLCGGFFGFFFDNWFNCLGSYVWFHIQTPW